VPKALLAQLAPGGRLVIPVGPDESSQKRLRVTRDGEGGLRQESLGEVRFVPLIGAQGWSDRGAEGDRERAPEREPAVLRPAAPKGASAASKLIREVAEPIQDLESSPVDALLERIGSARLVLLGEATHGTSEFYRMRARITKELIERRGFDFVAVEADWPDAARVGDYVLGGPHRSSLSFRPFARFPTWMWRNQEVNVFVSWLRARNLRQSEPAARVGFHGLDLYSMFTSIAAVVTYLDGVDPGAARVARARYGGLTPWQKDPAAYGQAVLVGGYASAERAVVANLRDLLRQRLEYSRQDGDRFFDATQNARLVAAAERYYRAMYYGGSGSWNLRDTHMFETLQSLFTFYGSGSRGIVWAHNSHVGNATATDMGSRGELNVGQLCRQELRDAAYIVGFETDHGTVAAASSWDAPMERMQVRPAHRDSYERLCHDAGVPAFMMHLREQKRAAVRDELEPPRLERAIGVVYRPETELASHYFHASLPHQFDELIWFDETHAVTPLPAPTSTARDLPETYPFGL